jgi:hypothetical protein
MGIEIALNGEDADAWRILCFDGQGTPSPYFFADSLFSIAYSKELVCFHEFTDAWRVNSWKQTIAS